MESEKPLHRLARRRSHRAGCEGGARGGPQAEGAGAHLRRRLHLGAETRAAHARSRAGGDGRQQPADGEGPGAERARLWRPVGPEQGRRAQEMGRGAGAHLAPLLRHRAAGRREPEGHAGAHAAVLCAGNSPERAARPAHDRRRPRQLAARAGDGAGAAVAGGHSQARDRDRRADHLPAQCRCDGGVEARSCGVKLVGIRPSAGSSRAFARMAACRAARTARQSLR